MAKRKHWTQTPEGRARMRDIALATNNVTKARLVKANGRAEQAAQLPKKREITLSIYDWQVTLSENEIRIRK